MRYANAHWSSSAEACNAKQRFPTAKAAREHFLAGKKQKRYTGNLKVYYCVHCLQYHLGHELIHKKHRVLSHYAD